MKAQTLKVPGATLYYETRGSGPVLLLIAGGGTDAGVFEAVAHVLAHDYTVVTYDSRGNSRSPLDGPPTDQQIAVHSDDARRLLSTTASGRCVWQQFWRHTSSIIRRGVQARGFIMYCVRTLHYAVFY